jgi:hypothetical protein
VNDPRRFSFIDLMNTTWVGTETYVLASDYDAQRRAALDNQQWFDALKKDYDAVVAERDALLEKLRVAVEALQAAYMSEDDFGAQEIVSEALAKIGPVPGGES